MQANKRFYPENIIQNPFKTELIETPRRSRFDNNENKLKMSLSFDAPPTQAQYHHQYQRSISEAFIDPRKERWNNGSYESRSYGSFHYDKIHHREPITTTYSMYRAQKASQGYPSVWNGNQVEQIVPPPVVPLIQPQIVPVIATDSQAEALKNATSDGFGGFLKEKLNAGAAMLPTRTKTASSDPRLNPSLVQDVKKDEAATPKKKVKLIF
jgi:hypothetical protein